MFESAILANLWKWSPFWEETLMDNGLSCQKSLGSTITREAPHIFSRRADAIHKLDIRVQHSRRNALGKPRKDLAGGACRMIRHVMAVLTATLALQVSAHAQQVWLSGLDPVVIHDRDAKADDNDYLSMFSDVAPWRKTAAAIRVFKVSTQFLDRASDEDLSSVIRGLRARHIALAMEAEILVPSIRCGSGVAGYGRANIMRKIADRVRKLDGEIAYVAFDEPMTFGHFTHRGAACGDSIEDLVRNMAPNIEALKAAFPGVQFGDIEPITDRTADRFDEIMTFAKVFQTQTGSRLSFLQADIIWQNQWQPQLIAWRVRLHAAGMRFGVIFDGDPGDKTDIEWAQHTVARYRVVMANSQMIPDDVVFQSWQKRPTRMLPEDQPGTMTSVVLDALHLH